MHPYETVILPEEVHDQLAEFVEESMQAAFTVIADKFAACGYPVTGDVGPDEAATLDRLFECFVRGMALNNPEIAAMNEEAGTW